MSLKGSVGRMRVLGMFENWAGKCVLDFDLKRPTATLVLNERERETHTHTVTDTQTGIVGYRK